MDTVYSVETPEGVGIDFSLAGPMVRAVAWFIDMAIRGVGYLIISFLLGLTGLLTDPQMVGGAIMLVGFLGEWFYPVLFEVYNDGRTPGKMVMKLSVVTESGSPVGWHEAMLRNLLRVVDFLPLFYGFGLLSILFNRRFQRLGDMVANTLVVYSGEQTARQYKLPECLPAPPLMPFKLDEQRAIIAFSERSETLSRERVVELATILQPVTGQKGRQGAEHLWGNAAWLVGKRP